MSISARNQLRGTVKSIKSGEIMAEVIVTLPNNQEVVAVITRASVEALGLREGDSVIAVIKSTDVLIQTS